MKSNNSLSATALKESLWDTINGVKTGRFAPSQAGAVAGSAKQILQTVKLQLQIANEAGRKVPADVIGFSER